MSVLLIWRNKLECHMINYKQYVLYNTWGKLHPSLATTSTLPLDLVSYLVSWLVSKQTRSWILFKKRNKCFCGGVQISEVLHILVLLSRVLISVKVTLPGKCADSLLMLRAAGLCEKNFLKSHLHLYFTYMVYYPQ